MSSYDRMNQASDQDIIRGIIRGDEASVVIFIKSYEDQVYRQAYSLLGNSQDAEEACQDIFMKALKSVHSFEGRSKLSTWIYQIAYRTCLDVIKSRNRRPYEDDIDDMAETSWYEVEDAMKILEREDQKSLIDSAMKDLESKDVHLLDMYYFQELSNKEISEITGLSENSVKVQMLRARKRLGKVIKRKLPVGTNNPMDSY